VGHGPQGKRRGTSIGKKKGGNYAPPKGSKKFREPREEGRVHGRLSSQRGLNSVKKTESPLRLTKVGGLTEGLTETKMQLGEKGKKKKSWGPGNRNTEGSGQCPKVVSTS